jgi:hypothetical protein
MMHRTSLRHTLAAVATAALAAIAAVPGAAHATLNTHNVALACSSALAITDTDGDSLSCTGDFSIEGTGEGALLSATNSLSIWASGKLSISGVNLTAPLITLTATDSIVVAPDVVFNDYQASTPPSVVVSAGGAPGRPVQLSPISGSLTLNMDHNDNFVTPGLITVVPEASTSALMLVGLGLVGLLARRRSSSSMS